MTDTDSHEALEGRLRRELPRLADLLIGDGDRESSGIGAAPRAGSIRSGRWHLRAAAVVVVVLAAVGGLTLAVRAVRTPGTGTTTVRAGSDGSDPSVTGSGSWRVLPAVPIPARSRPAAGWSGREFIVAFGTTTDSQYAFGDGAGYDPDSDTWRILPMPGWGHPGAMGVFLDGKFYVVAKASGARFDPDTGEWVDLPQVEGMTFSAVVATDDAVWGLGPSNDNPADLAVARLDEGTGAWVRGPSLGAASGLLMPTGEQEPADGASGPRVLWDGDRIVVWPGARADTDVAAFDPLTQQWSAIAAPTYRGVPTTWSTAVVTDQGLTAVAGVSGAEGPSTRVWVLDGTSWRPVDADLPAVDPARIDVAAAGEWLVILDIDEPPLTIHLPTGRWERSDQSPVRWVRGAVTVWNGSELFVWGGNPSFDRTAGSTPRITPGETVAAIWTP